MDQHNCTYTLMEVLGQLVSMFPSCPEKFNPDTATHLTFIVTFCDCLGLAGTGSNGEACKGCAYMHFCTTDVQSFNSSFGKDAKTTAYYMLEHHI